MTAHLSMTAARMRLQEAAVQYAANRLASDDKLEQAAIQFAAAKRRRNNSRDAWKLRNRLGETR